MAPVTVILPAFNEEQSVASQVRAIRRVLEDAGVPHEIIVVDDGSTDRTQEEALAAGVLLLHHHENRGYGASIKSAIAAAQHDVCVIIDADNTYPAEDIPILLGLLETADMVVGARTRPNVSIPWTRKPAKWLVGKLAQQIAGQRIPDLNSGLRAFRRECVSQYLSILPNRFSFTTTITLAYLADDYRVVYHPIEYYRRTGTSKLRPQQFRDFVILVFRMALLFQPLKVFVPLAFITGFIGVAKTTMDIIGLFVRNPSAGWSLIFQRTLSTSALLFLLLSFQLLLVGLVADGLLRRIAQRNRLPARSHAVWARRANDTENRDVASVRR
jgi:glycosyltransferase involved in cell wall biosynthesis